ncbi:conserved protein of unknown function [Streptomyces murinus]|uniref:P22 phage major capsid protein family protein n=1 Tax=Streptomyces murinus TaxID=33900 RepID=UPI003D66C1DA
MANNFEIDSVVAASLGLLSAKTVLGATVHRDAEKVFHGGRGDTVRVRIPAGRTAANFNGTTSYVDVAEGSVDVKLTDEPTDAAKITTKQASLDVLNYGAQVIDPQLDAVAKYVEKNIAGLLNEQSKDAKSTVIDPAADKPLAWITKAAAEFTKREIDPQDRFLAVGPTVYEFLLNVEQLQKVNEAGGDDALSKAEMGELFGFRVVVSPYLEGAVAYHRTAFALANRAPAASEGAGHSATSVYNGYALRVTKDFDAGVKSDVSIVDSFCGSTVLDARRFTAFKVKAA